MQYLQSPFRRKSGTVTEGMNMYFIALVLPGELNERILRFKHLMQERYGCRVGLKSPAHITLVPPYWMEEALEPGLLHDLDALAKELPPFSIATNNFSAFRPRTIFIDVVVNSQLAAVKGATDAFFKSHAAYGAKTDGRPFHPHITIATRDLHKKDFATAWPLFEQEQFQSSFSPAGLSVLRHNGREWDVIHTAAFAQDTPA